MSNEQVPPLPEPAAYWVPRAEQFCLAPKSGARPFAKAWEPLFTADQLRERDAMWVARVAATAAARDVLAERQRQVNVEGWTTEHDDDEHCNGELARAAGAYALYAAAAMSLHPGIATSLHRSAAGAWPWDEPSKANAITERRMLVKAGALILAEIERLDPRIHNNSPGAPAPGGRGRRQVSLFQCQRCGCCENTALASQGCNGYAESFFAGPTSRTVGA